MPSFMFELFVIFVLLFVNGVFAMSEMAFVSVRKTRLQQLAGQGDELARKALDLATAPNRMLSTVQVGITLVGIVSGVFGGATLAEKLAPSLEGLPYVGAYAEPVSFTLIAIGMTFLSVVFGELVPKRIALHSPEKIARFMAMPMHYLSLMASPVVHFFGKTTDFVLKILGLEHSGAEHSVTGEEIMTLIQQGTEAGTFDKTDQMIVERALEFGEQKVNAIMTPRPEVIWLDIEEKAEVNREKMATSPHSHFPVVKGSPENVLGVLHVKDLYARMLMGQPMDLTASLVQPLFVPESTDASKVLEMIQSTGIHIALVVDEYGVIQGLITLTDILEALVGQVEKPHPKDGESVVRRDDGSYLIDGLVTINELKDALDVDDLPGEDTGNFHTLAGFMMSQMGKIPRASDHFAWNGFRFEVIDMDGNRIDKVLVDKARPRH